ncbi:S41 family peptidase [Winogradskyella maritima]|uniref:S41 family peptidase n=1 Tax=Winogradskyella maritima TaxID=1517766 RepID=A0ABV8AD63_9FLAO|nr:S41 family peptidase [Winogradskyella maritima]
MFKTTCIVLFVFLMNCQSQNNKKNIEYSKIELEEDFNQMIDELENHPQINTFISESDWKFLVNTQKTKLADGLSIENFYRICLPIVAKIGCGHTNLYNVDYNASTKKSLVYLPYRFVIEDNQLYVIENLSENKVIPLGASIESINGEPIQDILTFILASMPADGYNISYRKRMASKGFTYYYHSLFGINDFNELSYKFGDTIKTLDFKCSKLIANKSFSKTADESLNFEIDEELNTGILTIKTFSFYDNVLRFHKFIDSSFAVLKKKNLKNLVIDLRGNQGGDPYCSSYLLRAISNEPIQYYRDDIDYPELLKSQDGLGFKLQNKPYILIDGFGFSSTGHFSALIKEHDLGIFVGEELGSTYSCNGGQENTILKNTGLFLQVGQKVVDVMVNPNNFDKSKGIMPDVTVKTNIQSRIENRDIYMEKVFELIKNRKNR